MSNKNKITENEIFRFFHCRLSEETCAKICDVSLMQVKKWDAGKTIPEYYKRLMGIYGGFDLSHIGWKNWQFEHGFLRTPMGYKVTAEQIEYWYIMHSPDVENRQSAMRLLRKTRR
jgi:hypothetical protein